MPKIATPILFEYIDDFNWSTCSDEQRNGIAEKVLQQYGIKGLLTLWSCQSYHDGFDDSPDGTPFATFWWLQDSNPYADQVRKELSGMSFDDALLVLMDCTKEPEGAHGLSIDPTPGMLLSFERCHSSDMNASTVRRIAMTFFSEHLALSKPTCALYREVVEISDPVEYEEKTEYFLMYAKPFDAFSHDALGQQYLAQALPDFVMAKESAERQQLRGHPDWNIFKDLSLNLEEAYDILKFKEHNLIVSEQVLSLPHAFEH